MKARIEKVDGFWNLIIDGAIFSWHATRREVLEVLKVVTNLTKGQEELLILGHTVEVQNN